MGQAAISMAYVDEDVNQRRLAIATNAAWKSGALLTVNSIDQWEECGADPALIGGVSLDEVGDGTGPLVPTGRREFPPYTCGAVIALEGVIFSGPFVGTPQIGNYGLIKGADGVWRVDFAETVNTRVRVVDVKPATEPFTVYPGGAASPFRYNGAEITGPISIGFVKFRFFAANCQQA